MGGSKGMLAANQPLVVPMLLRLSNFKLNSVVVLVVSKQKGITLVFKTDPLQNVDISSTFDSIAVIQQFIQKEIEGQLRQMFREDLPSIIHRVSQQWIKKSTTVEAPYLARRPPVRHASALETMSNPELPPLGLSLNPTMHPLLGRRDYLGLPVTQRRGSLTARTLPHRPSFSSLRASTDVPDQPFNHTSSSDFLEQGERHAFGHLGRIHRESRGLADLAEESSDYDGTEAGSFDVVDWEDTMTDILDVRGQPPAVAVTEYESIPAVGGGTITRPRIYHSTSMQRANSGSSDLPLTSRPSSLAFTAFPTSPTMTRRLSEDTPDSASLPASRRDSWDSRYVHPDLLDNAIRNQAVQQGLAEDELEDFPFEPTEASQTSTKLNTSPIETKTYAGGLTGLERPMSRRSSISSRAPPPSSPFLSASEADDLDSEPRIVLSPNANSAISQLSLLNRSNHTLSPFTRTLEHFTTRSLPPRNVVMRGRMNSGPAERQPVKAKRKRMYRLGGNKAPEPAEDDPNSSLELGAEALQTRSRLPSEFDESEIDVYFRPSYLHSLHADSSSHISPSHSRRRTSFSHRDL